MDRFRHAVAVIIIMCSECYIELNWRTWRSTANYFHELTVVLCTFCAPDNVFMNITIFHCHPDQYVLKSSLWINLHIWDFSQGVCHCDCRFAQSTRDSTTVQTSSDDRQHGAFMLMPYLGEGLILFPVLKRQTHFCSGYGKFALATPHGSKIRSLTYSQCSQ